MANTSSLSYLLRIEGGRGTKTSSHVFLAEVAQILYQNKRIHSRRVSKRSIEFLYPKTLVEYNINGHVQYETIIISIYVFTSVGIHNETSVISNTCKDISTKVCAEA